MKFPLQYYRCEDKRRNENSAIKIPLEVTCGYSAYNHPIIG